MDQYYEIGNLLSLDASENLSIELARRTLSAIAKNHNFRLIELRIEETTVGRSEVLVVESRCDGIPSKSTSGIKYIERLALIFHSDQKWIPEVKALRKDFPLKLHVSQFGVDQPVGLCLYFEPWASIMRSWTPEYHLKRITWWTENSAMNTLHPTDQPLEQPFFSSNYELILPADFDVQIAKPHARLVVPQIINGTNNRATIFAEVVDANPSYQVHNIDCMVLNLPPSVHTFVGQMPQNFSMLSSIFEERGIEFEAYFLQKLRNIFQNGFKKSAKSQQKISSIIILDIPVQREAEGQIEKHIVSALGCENSLLEIAQISNVVVQAEQYFVLNRDLSTGGYFPTSTAWKDIPFFPMETLVGLNKKSARDYSGISDSGPRGMIVGLGSLGSMVHDIWMKTGWGDWDYIDSDHLRPHNLLRHAASMSYLGWSKAEIALSMTRQLYRTETSNSQAYTGTANPKSESTLRLALETAEVIIDLSASTAYPRDHGANSILPRGISAFLTPDGRGSVIIGEDASRTYTLDVLEAQYFRFLLRENWGIDFLNRRGKAFSSGVTCRDISFVIPTHYVNLHSAIIAQQIPRMLANHTSAIKLFRFDDDSGSVQPEQIFPAIPEKLERGNYTIVWDNFLKEKVRKLRCESLPKETGGVLIGYFDFSLNSIYIVDVSSPPGDSEAEVDGFQRGTLGLEEYIKQAQQRSGDTVHYIGEWHSHPNNSSSSASILDFFQLVHLAKNLAEDGYPATMLIVGESDESWYVGQESNMLIESKANEK
ncbi:MAG: Mov34/MPN/PAD-1 family protein [Turneriella sp.]|nr:Mov34/MPN/PAD-1 family protein [Turneriella sp.]